MEDIINKEWFVPLEKEMTILENLKEMCKAYYDDGDKLIKNCAFGGLIWQHEMRHREQFKGGITRKLYLWTYLFFISLGMLSTLLYFFEDHIYIVVVGISAFPYLCLMFYFEFDAWVMAFYRRHLIKKYQNKQKLSPTKIPTQ